MGRDSHPRERRKNDLQRRKGKRPQHDRILVVCEGTKTEPHYFDEIRRFHKLQTASVQILPGQIGTAPIQVVEYAEALFLEGDTHKKILPHRFDRVYAVFDRDDHASFQAALQHAQSIDGHYRSDEKRPVAFRAIASVPCFELWLLLHFEDIQHPLHRNDVVHRLKTHINGYHKGMQGLFEATANQLELAARRAQALSSLPAPANDTEPYTAAYELAMLLHNEGALKLHSPA